MSCIDIDYWAGDSLGHQRETAAGPLSAALRHDSLAIAANGRITLPAQSYEPLVSIAPARDLGDEDWEVEVQTVDPGPPVALTRLDPLRFAPYSEKAGFLPTFVPSVGPQGLTGAAIVLRLRVKVNGAYVPLARTAELLTARYSEGRFARLLAVTQGETVRTRRLAREIAARRSLELSHGFQLDRIGRELAVPRFEDKISVKSGEMVISPDRETDAAYRNRLALYRPWMMPTRSKALERLNGAAAPLTLAGAPAKFGVLETDNPFMVSIKVFGVGQTQAQGAHIRANYLKYLRDTTLIDPITDVPVARQLSQSARQTERQMRLRLRARLDFDAPGTRSLAPWLARAFDRLVRTLDHLGVAGKLNIARAQDDSGGSRFELGLAAELKPLGAGLLNGVRAAVQAGPASASDAEIAGVLAALRAADLTASDGAWLFRACGFRTVAALTGGRMLLSHVSLGNLRIEGPDGLARGEARAGVVFSAKLQPEVGNIDFALANALAGGKAGWPSGMDDWTVVPPSQANAALAGISAPGLPQDDAFAAMGLAPPLQPAAFRQSLANYPDHVFRVLKLGAAASAALSASNSTASDRLGLIADTLGSNGAASLALLATAGGLVMVVGSIGLPQIGTNIGPRRSSDFFWSGSVLSEGDGIQLAGQGTRTQVKAIGDGLYAVTTFAYSRIGATDPFEWRVTLPPGEILTHPQYEMLMNTLDRLYPIGVEINTWWIRRRNVALDGVTVQPLTPRLSRNYRPYRRTRFQGSGDAPAS
jgi:hypothetical protein